MALFKFSFLKRFSAKAAQQSSSKSPQAQGQSSTSSQQSSKTSQTAPPSQIKSLAQLEQELEAEAKRSQAASASSNRAKPALNWRRKFNRFAWIALLAGVPLGALWVINLPYPIIRRPVAEHAPMLLLPSYMSIDQNYRDAISLVEQATQLVDRPTSFADIELGAEKVQQAQRRLDRLPTGFLNDYPDYRYFWYSWRFNILHFHNARARVGELQAKVFQEKNAHDSLMQADQAIALSQQQYQNATTPADRDSAVFAWQTALDQLDQIPEQTLAGRTAQQKFAAYQRNFQDVVGGAANHEQMNSMIAAAREFAWKAASAGQNPPHPVEQWQRVETLWSDAIARLESIPPESAAYPDAQQRLAEYRDNIEQIRIRRENEASSVATLQHAQQKIEQLQSNADRLTPNQTLSQLQAIANDLDRVQPGTTAYPEAQDLLRFTRNKIRQLTNSD
ncbi:MAG: hypothetical protein ACFE0I_22315 [Elainellaceae cyanobacterium]